MQYILICARCRTHILPFFPTRLCRGNRDLYFQKQRNKVILNLSTTIRVAYIPLDLKIRIFLSSNDPCTKEARLS